MAGSLAQFERPGSNTFIPLTNDEYCDHIHALDVMHRRSHRNGFFLNSEELISLVHLPDASVTSEKLYRIVKQTCKAPSIVENNSLHLGTNNHNGTTTQVSLSDQQRLKHTYIVGAQGSGKSTLLCNMIAQDMQSGHGLALLDPHGDLVDDVLLRVPEHRKQDVIVFDPSDTEFPIAFNILHAHTELEKELLASDLVGIFKRLSTSWGDQMHSVFANAILAFLEHKAGGSLLDLRRFLVDKRYRTSFLEGVQDSEITFFWEKEFTLLPARAQAPILTRLNSFLRPKAIRNMVGQQNNTVDFDAIMNGRKILLAKLAHGGIGEENAALLGALLVSKFQIAAASRQSLTKESRNPFYLYIDEFQNFTTPSMEMLPSGGRKYAIGLTLAHQELHQLTSRNAEVASSVLANPYSRICFRLGETDAKKLASGFTHFSDSDFQNLSIGEAICRCEQSALDFNLTTNPLSESDRNSSTIAEEIREHSRGIYAVPVSELPQAPEQTFEAPTTEQKALESVANLRQEKPADIPKPKTTPRTLVEPPIMGKGGHKHKYLQQLFKKVSEEYGYKADIEQQTDDGTGSVDLALSDHKRRIACEISITTPQSYELKNVQKCVRNGYDPVILISVDQKQLRKHKEYIESHLSETEKTLVRFMVPDEFLEFLEQHAPQKDEDSGTTVKGYKVKINYKALKPEELALKRKAIAKVIAQSMQHVTK